MLAILILLLLPLVTHLFFTLVISRQSSMSKWSQFFTILFTLIISGCVVSIFPYADLKSGLDESFFNLHLMLTPFQGAMVLYFILSYGLTFLIEEPSEASDIEKPRSRLILVISAIGLVLAANFYAVLIFCSGLTISLIVSNNRQGAASKSSMLQFYLRKECSDFFLLVGLLLLSYNQSINDYASLDQLVGEEHSYLSTISMLFVSVWFAIRLRIFPFLSLRQSYFKSIGPRLQALFMSVYLPALVIVFYYFTPFIEQLPLVKIILIGVGAISILCYSMLMLLSRRLESAQTFYIYGHYGIIPLVIGLGTGGVLAYQLIYMSILLASMVYIGALVRRYGLHTIDDLAQLKYQQPLLASLMAAIFLLIIGFPFVGLFSIKYELLWTAVNESHPAVITTILLICLILLTASTARYIFALVIPLDDKEYTKPSKRRHIVLTVAIFIGLLVLGILGLPRELGILNNPLLALFSSGMSDLRIFYQEQWVRYLVITGTQLLPLIAFFVIYLLMKKGFHGTNIGSGKKMMRMLEAYIHLRSSSYSLSLRAKGKCTQCATVILRKFDNKFFQIIGPIFSVNEYLSAKIDGLRVTKIHAHLLTIVSTLVLLAVFSAIYFAFFGGMR